MSSRPLARPRPFHSIEFLLNLLLHICNSRGALPGSETGVSSAFEQRAMERR
jgi:hypothetical protein